MAYNKQDILNYKILDTANELYDKKIIEKIFFESIIAKFPHNLYAPTRFLGLVGSIITIIGCLFASCFVGLLFSFSNFRFMSLLCAVLSIIALEVGIRNNKLYNAGTDNVLQVIAVSCITVFYTADLLNPSDNAFCYLGITLLCIACSYRYIDTFMAINANISAIIFIALTCFSTGSIGKMIAPFIIFIFSTAEYFTLKGILASGELFIFKKVFTYLSVLSLILIYGSLNYYVVCELNNMMNNTHSTSIPLGWLFWIATFTIPIVYIIRSVATKNKTLLLVGIACLIASFASFRYYHSLLPTEWALFLVGLISIVLAYWLIKFLHETKNGFTSQNIYQLSNKNEMLQSMIAAQMATNAASDLQNSNSKTHFGGGSSGGGGATGDF